MRNPSAKIVILLACLGLSSCFETSGGGYVDEPAYNTKPPMSADDQRAINSTTQLASNESYERPMGGRTGRSMDVNDKSKMAHALDNPLGKSTRWVNENTGTTYTVVPRRKVSINGNPYCREYTTTITNGNKTRERTSTACVDSNGKWQAVSGG